MTSAQVREAFLAFFEQRDHKRLPSASLVPDDPTLLLTGAGMVPLKPYMMGIAKPEHRRITTAQKCVRTTDIERVGHTSRHLTFFEMMGNFSIGDYFKEAIIPWSWEFCTEVLGLEKDRLWITVYLDDDEAAQIWQESVGLPSERIVRLGEDNFWSVGPTGPCGPCSEIIYDQGESFGCGKPDCAVGCDCDRYLEIWNLVFMQFNRQEGGDLEPLPFKNIDTGLGLERVASLVQGVRSNFETDLVRPIIDFGAGLAGMVYGADENKDVSLRIMADHCRSMTFLISDGVLPSNEGRGYILRRLIRRAVRHGRLLGIDRAFLGEGAALVTEIMGEAYPELVQHREFTAKIVGAEEERFAATLRQGLTMLSGRLDAVRSSGAEALSGEDAFRLYDTYGFPVELTCEIAAEAGMMVDLEGFASQMQEQKDLARGAHEQQQLSRPKEVYAALHERRGDVEFVGYELDETPATAVGLIVSGDEAESAIEGQEVEVVLDVTPFYGEQGGQVGDTGIITFAGGAVEVRDAQLPIPGFVVHVGVVTEGTVRVGETVQAGIDTRRREAIRRNHTTTHLLQWALRLVLGEHIKQSGSHVAEDRLRFDFSHYEAMTPAEIDKVERLINSKVAENHPVRAFVTTKEFARESGAVALFGEKYGDYVRLVEVGNFSKELCGGTHAGRTSEIGLFKIVSEASVGASLRRIEGVTSWSAYDLVADEERQLEEARRALKASTTHDIAARIDALIAEARGAKSALAAERSRSAGDVVDGLLEAAREVDGRTVVVGDVSTADGAELRQIADRVRARLSDGVIVLGGAADGKVSLLVAATGAAVSAGFDATALIRVIAPMVGGGGGGRPELAQAGGKKPDGLADALAKARSELGVADA